MTVAQRLQALGITLPDIPSPLGNYVDAVQTGNLLFLAGRGAVLPDGTRPAGQVGAEVSVEQAQAYARIIALLDVAVMQNMLGDLERVTRIVKVLGMVNAVPGFTEHPRVINGFSDAMVEIFGERGRHARSAVGMGSLPLNIPVEIEVIVEVAPASGGGDGPPNPPMPTL